MQAHVFDQAVALTPVAGESGVWRGHTSPAYANMIGPFGGITAAQALNAVLRSPELLGEPVSFTVNFASALSDGEFTVHARAARTNRSTQHWVIEVRQRDETVLTATAFTALRRDTWSASEIEPPVLPRPDDLPVPETRGRVEWVRRYSMRFAHGDLPRLWDGATEEDSLSQLWVRDEPPRALDFASLTALSDVFFPRIWRRRAQITPIGTVSMTVYFHADAALLRATGSHYLLAQARAQAFRKGYFDQTAQLWNAGGDLLASTHQVVYYKE